MLKKVLSTQLLAITLLASTASETFGQSYQNWYPSSIALPQGHSYPCALTGLPTNLEGIPAGDRRFINHVYALLLQCVQAKTIMIDCLMTENGAFSSSYSRYYAQTAQARQKIMAEPVPANLQAFRDNTVNALDTQIRFFARASQARSKGTSYQEVIAYPEGRQASGLLMAAWSAMQSQYPSMAGKVKDSTYHHLCALDLF
jgi:hypothetical protein